MTKKTKAARFHLNMDPDEFLERAIRTKPDEVEKLIGRGKKRKPPGTKAKASGGTSQSKSDTVVSLRSRRMRKRNEGR
jgi:hypothetical protein